MTLEEREKNALLFEKFKNLLTQAQRQALQLYLIEDVSITEIGAILATTRQAANDAIKKGIKKLTVIGDSVEI